jgi:dipeptidyl aminopeptidase/acylaminoacyl peptidase
MRSVGIIAVSVLVASAAPCANAAPITLQSLRGIVHIKDVQISRDGSKVAFVRSIGDYQHDLWKRTLVVVAAAGGPPQVVTAAMNDLDDPHWSPSGTQLAYLANDKAKTVQLFVVPARGGPARQVTHTARDVEQYAWSPDGAQLAYVTQDGPRKPRAAAHHDDLWEVHDDGFLTVDEPRPSHLWLVNAGGGTPRRLTHGSWSILEADPPFVGAATDPSWSADGKTIAFTMQANADDSDSDRTSIAKVDVATGAVTKLDGRTQYEYQPIFAPYGSQLAYLYPHGPGPVSVLDLFVAGYGRNADMTAELDRDVTFATWLPGNRLAMLAAEGTRKTLFVQTLPLGYLQRVSLGELIPSEISTAGNGAIAMIATASNVLPEVYILKSIGAAPRKLTSFNAIADAKLEFGKSEDITWTAPDGERSDGVLTYPIGYQPGKKYPLVLRIHGGPEASSSIAYEDLPQLFASHGYLVFQPNYRGSDNLGTAHEHAIFRDPGAGPGTDVTAGVAAIEAMGIVDTAREAVTGHSYGGYMTAWLIGHSHNWRCAVIGDGAFDWVETYDLSATGNLAWARDSLGGSPWATENATVYRDGSPITYVHDMQTPTRLISGTADEQVPVSESYELYHALHDLGVPVSFIVIPGAKHFPKDPVHIEGYNRVTLDWVDRYLR